MIFYIFRYEKVALIDSDAKTAKLEEAKLSLSNINTKLDVQIKRGEFYKKQHDTIMDTLNIPKDNRNINMILPAIVKMKKTLKTIEAQNEGNLLSIAQELEKCL